MKTQVYNIAQYSMTAHLFGLNFCLFIQIVFLISMQSMYERNLLEIEVSVSHKEYQVI